MRAAKMFVRFLKGEKEGAKHKYGYVPVVKIHLHHSLLPGKSCSSQGVHKAWPHSCCRNCVVYTDSGRWRHSALVVRVVTHLWWSLRVVYVTLLRAISYV